MWQEETTNYVNETNVLLITNVVKVGDVRLERYITMPSRDPFIDEGNPRTTYIKVAEIWVISS